MREALPWQVPPATPSGALSLHAGLVEWLESQVHDACSLLRSDDRGHLARRRSKSALGGGEAHEQLPARRQHAEPDIDAAPAPQARGRRAAPRSAHA